MCDATNFETVSTPGIDKFCYCDGSLGSDDTASSTETTISETEKTLEDGSLITFAEFTVGSEIYITLADNTTEYLSIG